ncbi:Canalicular multispecific organic anion transporter 2 [Mortierella polycephala]|uniref:Canalicular multispecific organic anion transporter 2 n=1 Tax=Mortierella polycephala TaxID=41804 RepID=A0A9P6PQC3_9FUNG|nr:Canalicular multispecific organic anion transporter 2 [Mortierella polycephala]
MVILISIGFIVEAWPRGSTKVQRSSALSVYEKANLFSQATYYFYQPIISLSVKRALTLDDISGLLLDSIRSENGYRRLNHYWNKAQQKAALSGSKDSSAKTPSLLRAVIHAQMARAPALTALRLSRVFANYSIPAILSLLLAYFQDIQRGSPPIDETDIGTPTNGSGDKTSISYGLLLVAAMFFAGLANAILLVASRQYCIIAGLEARSSLISMIYRKALKLSPRSRQTSTTGSITNHMAIDADVWSEGFSFLAMWISIPAEIGLGIWLLYRLLGWSVWVGLLVMVAMTPLQIWRAKVFGKMQRESWCFKDERVRLATEVLAAIKVVKLYAWENAFLKKILAVRNLELEVARRIGIITAIMSIVNTSATLIVSLVTLTVYATWGGPNYTPAELTPQAVFVSMTLFAMLKTPISSLTEATTATVNIIVATKRVQDFLLREEINEGDVVRSKEVPLDPYEPVIIIKDAAFTWTDDGGDIEDTFSDERQPLMAGQDDQQNIGIQPTLHSLNIPVLNESLTAVVGRVGQGKSSLLSAIIGEMYKVQGTVQISGRVAYVPQQAWIINATLKDNILFGNEFDEVRYKHVLFACGLEPDLDMLPAGDLTEIGERGINLSGGQKQRVSLARAAYSNADIYLLDDPLSAVDAHVDQHLWIHLIGPKGLLGRKARLLVTHGTHHLQDMDQILLLRNGQVAESGHYEELIKAGQTFYQLIQEYSVTHKNVQVEDRQKCLMEGSPVSPQSEVVRQTEGQGSAGSRMVVGTAGCTVPNDSNPKDMKKNTMAKIIVAETIEVGAINADVVMTYIRAVSFKNAALVVVLHILAQICLVGPSLWLKHWINLNEAPDRDNPPSLSFFLTVFAVMTMAYVVICVALFWIAFAVARIRASEYLHRELITRILRLPPAFFDTTPLGRIVNRLSSDFYYIDERLPMKVFDTINYAVGLLSALIIVAITTPVFLIASPFIFLVFYIIKTYYMHASLATKRMMQVLKSPIFQHFQETLAGVSTIRAMGLQESFIHANAAKTDLHANAFLAVSYCIRWVEIQTQLVSIAITLMATLWFVLAPQGSVNAATAGLALSFAMTISNALIWFTRSYCDQLTHFTSVERIKEFLDMKTEAPAFTEPGSKAQLALRNHWPDRGQISFRNYSTRYRQGLDLVIKNISFSVQPGEKVGIVGRTGAGKSSLTLALFRMVEAANSYWAKASDNTGQRQSDSAFDPDDAGVMNREMNGDHEEDGGSIEIDGIDISTVGLHDLRHQLAIIPQDPILFAGTVRDNLDPFQELEDSDLWEALERSYLKDYIRSLPGGLSFEVSQNGENFSVGQRSLICVARALLRKTKILVMDEATAAVDVETDELIQRTIRKEFKDRTVLTIAHRIKTVMDADRILVLDQGRVAEYDSPRALLRKEDSLFCRLARQAGELQ